MVQINIPERLPTGRNRLIVIGVVIIVVTATAIYMYARSNQPEVAPEYAIVLPQQTSIDTLGGWQRVSPDGKDPIFAYSDTVEDIAISVSQQPLPESFVGNVAASVKQLADSYSATTAIEAGGTDVYIGRSAKGPQSLIFAKGDTLVLIKSQKAISQEEWIRYINNLVNPDSEQIPTF